MTKTTAASEREHTGAANAAAWVAGAAAGRAGQPASKNPHPPEKYAFVTWLNGWAQGKHQQAKEDEL